MTNETFERLRLPVAGLLLALAAVLLWPRGSSTPVADPGTTPTAPAPTVVVGGAVIEASLPATPSTPPTATATAPATPSPVVTPAPAPDTFSARIQACRRLDGSRCRGEFEEFPRRSDSFIALVTFSDARSGDVISARLTGPGVEIHGGPFTLDGGGDGYYYATIRYDDLPEGDYALIALRNGIEVARIGLERD